MFVKEIKFDNISEIKNEYGVLKYKRVTFVYDETESVDVCDVPNRTFMLEDYSYSLDCKEDYSSYYITLLEVNSENRRKGYGSRIVKEFFDTVHPNIVLLRGAITDEKLYYKLCDNGKLMDYINSEILPFWLKQGFTDVNHTYFIHEQSIPMLWPKSEAERVITKFKSESDTTL